MKKYLFLASVAALSFTACTNETEEYVGTGSVSQQKEIGVVALNQVATKHAVNGTTFLPADNFDVVAYLAEGGSAAGDYFASTNFQNSGDNVIWHGTPARYWPLSASTLNFLAVTNKSGEVEGKISTAFGVTEANYASKAVVTLSGNAVWNQADLMYAAGQGKVTQSGNTLTYGNNVPLQFQHALAWINFNVKTTNDVSGQLAIKVNSITLKQACYNGTYTINNVPGANTGYDGGAYAGGYQKTAADAVTAEQWANLVGVWSDFISSKTDRQVPNAAHDAAQGTITLTNAAQAFGSGLLIVPNGEADGFTINYTISQNGKETTYDYTYTFTELEKAFKQRMKYTFDINITLTEILIQPSVANWTDATTSYVNIPQTAFANKADGAYAISAGAGAGIYTFAITGMTGTTDPAVAKGSPSADFKANPVLDSYSAGVAKVSFEIPANTTGADKTYKITVTDDGTSGSNFINTITITQAH